MIHNRNLERKKTTKNKLPPQPQYNQLFNNMVDFSMCSINRYDSS